MRRQFLALVPFLLAADAGAQIIRPGIRGREPAAWASFGAALQGTFDVRDGTTSSLWQFGDATEFEDPIGQDLHDMNALYAVLTQDVVPTFYKNQPAWRMMMRKSIVSTKAAFSVERMLEEYYELLYC